MFSVIIPTMWKYSPFLDVLKDLVNVGCIDEIIIINNDKDNTPDCDTLNHSKIKIHNSETNLYVNPSWNLGVKLAKNNKLAFFSDDVSVNLKVFDKVNNFLTDDVGMIGILSRYLDDPSYDKFMRDGSIDILYNYDPDPEKRPPPIGIGNLFFLNKGDWKDLPNNLKVFHGELLQWNRLSSIKKNYIITNCHIETPGHVTWKYLSITDNTVFSRIQVEDQKIAEEMGFNF